MEDNKAVISDIGSSEGDNSHSTAHPVDNEEEEFFRNWKPDVRAQREEILGCFNIQNKFEHMKAAELFLLGKFSILSFQEPFATRSTNNNESWNTFMVRDLSVARIHATITKHQVLFLDEQVWGGRFEEDIRTVQDGRGISVLLNAGNGDFWGIISIYNHCVEFKSQTSTDTAFKKHNAKRELLAFVENTLDRWRKLPITVSSVIMGDFQETESVTDDDNLGNFRCEKPRDGILNMLNQSHSSVVRELGTHKHYITRVGTKGGRGIDHIFCPRTGNMASHILSANIQGELGHLLFQSDHLLLTCTINRWDQVSNLGDFIVDKET